MAAKPTYEELEQKVAELEERCRDFQYLERELADCRERYNRVIEAVTSYVFSVRVEEGQPVRTIHRPPCEAVTGYTPEEFERDAYLWINMVPQEDRHIVQEQAAALLAEGRVRVIEHRIMRKDGTLRWVSNTPVPQYDGHGRLIAYEGLIRDITERRLISEERESLIITLQKALDEIKTLKGILPICSYCKKIRDDKGYWNQLESYIQSHSAAEFSHSICEDCLREHHQEVFDDVMGEMTKKED